MQTCKQVIRFQVKETSRKQNAAITNSKLKHGYKYSITK